MFAVIDSQGHGSLSAEHVNELNMVPRCFVTSTLYVVNSQGWYMVLRYGGKGLRGRGTD
jgi:hypothetical protein